jgi:hypothetical protein
VTLPATPRSGKARAEKIDWNVATLIGAGISNIDPDSGKTSLISSLTFDKVRLKDKVHSLRMALDQPSA